jgi:cell wall-associated NlpC family hydrolase
VSVNASVAAVQQRIQQIQTQFAGRVEAPARAPETSSRGGVRSASAAAFGLSLANATGDAGDVLGIAQQYLGVPYVWGGETPSGFDCSGFVQYVFRQVGVELPRVSADQAQVGAPVASLAEAQPGDLVAFNSPVDHIGIYAGGGKMIVAPKTGDVVKVQDIYETPTAIRRVLPDETPPAFSSVDPNSVLSDRMGFLASLMGSRA